jgi:hypothetical protein
MPDITGHRSDDGASSVEWLAEVETEDTLCETQALGPWRRSAALLVPMYLVVPKGLRHRAWSLAFRAGVAVHHVFEYAIADEVVELS